MVDSTKLRIKNEDFPGPVTENCESFVMNTEVGTVLSAGTLPPETCIISLDTLPINGIKVMQGASPLGPVISLNLEGIKLAFGGPVGPRIELTPTGITLAFGPPGVGASISLSATGITLQMGPTNQIQLMPTGLNLQGLQLALQAMTSMQVQALQLTETVAGPVTRTGAATTMM